MSPLLTLALYTIGWCTLHSLLICPPATRLFRAKLGPAYRFHRLAYNLVAVVTLLLLMFYERQVGGATLFSWAGTWRLPWAFLLAAALGLFLAGGRHYDLLQFLGVRQAMRATARRGVTASGELDTQGILGLMRHPWYLGALLVIWLRDLNRSAIVVNALFSLYLVVGSILEERKLVAEFGDEYRRYQRRVPMLLPRPRRWRQRS